MSRPPNPQIDPIAFRKARHAAGPGGKPLSAKALAEIASRHGVKITGPSVQAYEAGYYGPPMEKLEALARAMGVRVETLLPSATQVVLTRTRKRQAPPGEGASKVRRGEGKSGRPEDRPPVGPKDPSGLPRGAR